MPLKKMFNHRNFVGAHLSPLNADGRTITIVTSKGVICHLLQDPPRPPRKNQSEFVKKTRAAYATYESNSQKFTGTEVGKNMLRLILYNNNSTSKKPKTIQRGRFTIQNN